ncbi:hypothetical protein K439DRAFT_1416998 [Ramaria rubella]|nr:hypothetical protein K439DRAFT_1416998 [Ramaria rubella]
MQTHPPTKKRKLSETLQIFDDGNIVLVAEGLTFRVHRSQMARHSPVFQDIFALPTTSATKDICDECLMVTLSDKADDITKLPRILYDHFDCYNRRGLQSLSSTEHPTYLCRWKRGNHHEILTVYSEQTAPS